MLDSDESQDNGIRGGDQSSNRVRGEPKPPHDYPPFPVTVTTWATHLGVATSVIEGCGHAVLAYAQWATGQLYTLGWIHPERWLQWDADRAALHLPAFIPGWLYFAAAIGLMILSVWVFKWYVRFVRVANERAWAWIRDFLYQVILEALSDFLKDPVFLGGARQFIIDIIREFLGNRRNDPPDGFDGPMPSAPPPVIC